MPTIETVRANLQQRIRRFVESTARGTVERRDEITRSINQLYESSGYKAPLVVICESPYQANAMDSLLEIQKYADRVARSHLKVVAKPYRDDRLFQRLLEHAQSELAERRIKNISERGDDFRPRFLDVLKDRRTRSIESILDQKMGKAHQLFQLLQEASVMVSYSTQLIAAFIEFTNASSEASGALHSVRNSFPAPILANLSTLQQRSATSSSWLPLNSTIENGTILVSVETSNSLLSPAQQAPLEIRTDDFEQLLQVPKAFWTLVSSEVLSQQSRYDEIAPLAELSETVFTARFCENVCFVCPYPKSAIDDQLRHHNGVGPAIEFPDGQKRYAWRGQAIAANLVESRSEITPASIDKQTNQELRRIMLEMYGYEQYVRNSKIKIVSSDDCGILYRKRYWDFSESLQIVEVINSTSEPDGTYKRYFLRVPPSVRTAREAVAWTFGLTTSEYAPRKQT